jgi:hypothetical protein
LRLTEISLKRISAVTIIVFTAMGLVLTYSTAGLISFQNANSKVNRQLPSSGNIAAINVGLYSDYACTLKMESIDWGDIAPGESVNKVIYLKNPGEVTSATLTLATVEDISGVTTFSVSILIIGTAQ